MCPCWLVSCNTNGSYMSDTSHNQSESADQTLAATRSKLVLFLKGLLMGFAESVPGISGGTIAVITNIYDKLIYSIRAVDVSACQAVFAGRFIDAWRHINGSFLLILAIGMLSGLLLSANTVLYLLVDYFAPLMGFFIGMVLSSCWLLKNEFNLRSWSNMLALALGLVLVIGIGSLDAQAVQPSYVYIFFCGIIGISALVLPGLSGAFVLLVLGVYQFILEALIQFDLPYILIFSLGCVVGLIVFSRVLSWLLLKHHQLSYGFISGLLLGSITVLWPWQQELSSYMDSSGESHSLATANVSPLNYYELSGEDPLLVAVIVSIIMGVFIVSLMHWVFNSRFRDQAE